MATRYARFRARASSTQSPPVAPNPPNPPRPVSSHVSIFRRISTIPSPHIIFTPQIIVPEPKLYPYTPPTPALSATRNRRETARSTVSECTNRSIRRLHHPLIAPPRAKTPPIRSQNAQERWMTTKFTPTTTLPRYPLLKHPNSPEPP